jgi:sec-independent protein translocase protein TatA
MNLGMPEIMIILVIALIVFGPRKLPELGKSLGKAMGQFRRASEDFKRTWEQEVELEKTRTPAAASTALAASSTASDYGNESSYSDSGYNDSGYYNQPNDGSSYNYSSGSDESAQPGDDSRAPSPAPAEAAAGTQPRPESKPRAERWI